MELRIIVSNHRWLRRNLSLLRKLSLGIEIVDFADPDILNSLPLTNKRLEFYKKPVYSKVPISLHGANIGLDPGSLNSKIVNLTEKDYIRTAQIGNDLSVDFIIFHSCIDSKLGEFQLGKWMDKQIALWRKIDIILDPKIQIVLENVYERNMIRLKDLVNYINHCLGKKRMGVCIDVGHLRLYAKELIGEAFKILKNEVGYIHLHTNNKKFDQHKPLSSKTFKNISRLLISLGINPVFCLDYGISDLQKEISRVETSAKTKLYSKH